MSTANNEFCFLNTVPHSKKPELIREMANSKFGKGDNMSKGQIVLEEKETLKSLMGGFPGGAVVESLPANAGDTGSSPGLGRSHMPWSN